MNPPARWSRRHGLAGFVCAAIAILVHFGVVLGTPIDGMVYGDGLKYLNYAHNIKHHQTFSHAAPTAAGGDVITPDKLTLPGYPAFLAVLMEDGQNELLSRGSYERIRLAQAALGVVTTLLAFCLALQVLPFGWAVAAGLLTATLPHLAVADTHLLTEPLFTSLMLASVLAVVLALRPGARIRSFVVAGLLIGLASLVRPQLQMLPLLALLAVVSCRRLRPRLIPVLVGVACFAAVMSPWLIRNARTPDAGPNLLLMTLYHGSFPGFMYKDDPRTFGYPYRFHPQNQRLAREPLTFADHLLHEVTTEPSTYLRWYFLGKPAYFLAWSMVEGPGDIFVYPTRDSPYFHDRFLKATRSLHFLLHWPLMLLGLAGAVLVLWKGARFVDIRRRPAVVALAALAVYLVVLHSIGAPYPRYNIPFRPIFFICALVLAHGLVRHLARRRETTLGSSAA